MLTCRLLRSYEFSDCYGNTNHTTTSTRVTSNLVSRHSHPPQYHGSLPRHSKHMQQPRQDHTGAHTLRLQRRQRPSVAQTHRAFRAHTELPPSGQPNSWRHDYHDDRRRLNQLQDGEDRGRVEVLLHHKLRHTDELEEPLDH